MSGVLFVGELSVRVVFCVAGRIFSLACSSRLGIRVDWKIYFSLEKILVLVELLHLSCVKRVKN